MCYTDVWTMCDTILCVSDLCPAQDVERSGEKEGKWLIYRWGEEGVNRTNGSINRLNP